MHLSISGRRVANSVLGLRQALCVFKFVFFFQAEDGIRDLTVTGVQTCALPILEFLADYCPSSPLCLFLPSSNKANRPNGTVGQALKDTNHGTPLAYVECL